jgi:FkbM family methyltransferase
MQFTKHTEIVETIYGTFTSWEGDLITNQLKQYSAHTRNELAMLKTLINEGDNIIDIGAHVGTFSIPFARFNNGKGKIYSFEADPENYELLKLNIITNSLDKVVFPSHAIVTDSKKSFIMLKPCDDNSGMNYFLPESGLNNTVNSHTPVINIDEWFELNGRGAKIHLIKIDIEGAELAALRCCKKIINKNLPILYVEISKTALDRFHTTTLEIEEVLMSFGYKFFKNAGDRNSDNDIFKIVRLEKIDDGGDFYDLLAVHPSSDRYIGVAET